MISFRYHLVSIVAVFLALALGVLVGTTVVNQGVIDQLRGRTDQAIKTSEQLRRLVAELQAEVSAQDDFARAVEPMLLRGELTGRRVVLVTAEGVDVSEVASVRDALEEGGATVAAVVLVTQKMAGADDGARDQLAEVVNGAADDPPTALARQAAQMLGSRLAGGPDASGPDFLQDLAAEKFVQVQVGGAATIEDVGAPDQGVLVLLGGQPDPAVEPRAFFTPLVESLVGFGRPVVAGETSDSSYPFVQVLRDDPDLDGLLVTVDDANSIPGRVAVVLGLHDLLLTGEGGDYGIDGADGVIPER